MKFPRLVTLGDYDNAGKRLSMRHRFRAFYAVFRTLRRNEPCPELLLACQLVFHNSTAEGYWWRKLSAQREDILAGSVRVRLAVYRATGRRLTNRGLK